MSFTSIVKNELSKLELEQIEKISLLSAILKNNSQIDNKIKISTENSSLARYIFTLIKDLYSITPRITVRKGFLMILLLLIMEMASVVKSKKESSFRLSQSMLSTTI